jgi:hypothetical protein
MHSAPPGIVTLASLAVAPRTRSQDSDEKDSEPSSGDPPMLVSFALHAARPRRFDATRSVTGCVCSDGRSSRIGI